MTIKASRTHTWVVFQRPLLDGGPVTDRLRCTRCGKTITEASVNLVTLTCEDVLARTPPWRKPDDELCPTCHGSGLAPAVAEAAD